MRYYQLPETVLQLKGNVSQFLNGLTSNTLDEPVNAFLNQHGRLITTFHQKKISDEDFLIGIPSSAVEALLAHVDRYAKLNHINVQTVSQNLYMDLDTWGILWTPHPQPTTVSNEEFTLFRLNAGMPLMGIDYQAGEFILNISEDDYVSYTKGCFLGQEPVAKVHNRSKPSRKLVVAFEDQCSAQEAAKMTSKVEDPTTGRRKGFVFVANS